MEHTLSRDERFVLIHTLTGSPLSNPTVYRIFFAANLGHFRWPILERLVSAGLMRRGRRYEDGHYYHCTAAGASAVGLYLPARIGEGDTPIGACARSSG